MTTVRTIAPRAAKTVAIRLGSRARLAVTAAGLIGFVAVAWPLVLAPGRIEASTAAPLLFGVLLLLVLAVVIAEIAEGGIDAKAVAMLGVLSAIGAALRPLGAGTAGIETIFFTLVLAGRVFGSGFGFTLGCTTLFSSALITGGVGPWLPFQMFGAAMVGLGAGVLPRVRGRWEIALLAGYGAIGGYLFGLVVNLSSWPFTVDPASSIGYRPGASFATQLHRYLAFDATTSLGWDTGRALTTAALIGLTGPALLATFRRAARRAAFQAPVEFGPLPSPTASLRPGEPVDGPATLEP